jgi:hypothetical protein
VVGGQTDPVPPPGYPPAGSYPVRRCLRTTVRGGDGSVSFRILAESRCGDLQFAGVGGLQTGT